VKKSIWVLSLVSLYGSAYAADFTETVRVTSSTPIYDRVSEPRRECWMETVQVEPREHSIGGAVVGGIAGGILGNQLGGGDGRVAATALGTFVGVMVGDRVANPDQPRSGQVERCRQVDRFREVITGYNVTYRYNGRDIHTTLPYDPGSWIQVSVSVIEERRY
jgi:uncharacterized protein YcfJ